MLYDCDDCNDKETEIEELREVISRIKTKALQAINSNIDNETALAEIYNEADKYA